MSKKEEVEYLDVSKDFNFDILNDQSYLDDIISNKSS